MSNVRQGNIELLRILCMAFVMLFHFNLNAILRNGDTSQNLNHVALLVNSLVVVAVNTFVLISGFFSIKIKAKSVLSYLVQTEFYALLAIVVLAVYSICESYFLISKDMVLGLIPFRPSGLWFVPCYALLMVISPLLNWICEDKRAHLITMSIIALGGVILYITRGYTGYDIYNFILLYLIGRWIALYAKENSYRQRTLAALVLFCSVALTFVLAMWWISKGHAVDDKKMYAYCAPWVVASSVSLFLVFKNMKVTQSWVYYMAPSVFSVYLFHENSLIDQIIYIKPLRFIISIIPSDDFSYLLMVIYGIILFVLIVVFDRYVRMPIQRHIMEALTRIRIIGIIDSKLLKLNE